MFYSLTLRTLQILMILILILIKYNVRNMLNDKQLLRIKIGDNLMIRIRIVILDVVASLTEQQDRSIGFYSNSDSDGWHLRSTYRMARVCQPVPGARCWLNWGPQTRTVAVSSSAVNTIVAVVWSQVTDSHLANGQNPLWTKSPGQNAPIIGQNPESHFDLHWRFSIWLTAISCRSFATKHRS